MQPILFTSPRREKLMTPENLNKCAYSDLMDIQFVTIPQFIFTRSLADGHLGSTFRYPSVTTNLVCCLVQM